MNRSRKHKLGLCDVERERQSRAKAAKSAKEKHLDLTAAFAALARATQFPPRASDLCEDEIIQTGPKTQEQQAYRW